MKDKVLNIASGKGLEPTEHFDKIVRAKERLGFDLKCPCDPNNSERYCVGDLCMSDILEKGTCHCNCWRKK